MKLFTAAQLRELDQYTIENEPVKSIDLMERAAKAITRAITEEWDAKTPVVVFAGPGNNGGDALAVARLLHDEGYHVSVYLFNIYNNLSADCTLNRERLQGHVDSFVEVSKEFDPPQLEADMLVIDGLFGTGLNKPLSGGFASLVKYINQSPSKIVSIDIPSGLMCEDNSNNIHANIVRAYKTLTIQLRKISFLFADTQQYIGKLRILNIGLSQKYMQEAKTQFTMFGIEDAKALLMERDDYCHKGSMGHAMLIAGSYGMSGAAILAARACLRAGAGKLTVVTPRSNYAVMQTSIPEAILKLDNDSNRFTESVDTSECDALGIGPGLGTIEETAIALIGQLRRTKAPIVADADALNILASHRAWMQQLPKEIILTPHPKELERLDGNRYSSDYELFSKGRELSRQLQAYVLLKGHHSALCIPNGDVVFNTTGNSGMATAGSGDVLTGIITGLLARGYQQADACKLGMFLHGLAGDLAAIDLGKESLMASDIIRYLPKAFLQLA